MPAKSVQVKLLRLVRNVFNHGGLTFHDEHRNLDSKNADDEDGDYAGRRRGYSRKLRDNSAAAWR